MQTIHTKSCVLFQNPKYENFKQLNIKFFPYFFELPNYKCFCKINVF